jgi:hypothetical protein
VSTIVDANRWLLRRPPPPWTLAASSGEHTTLRK